ncbi:MAG: hypothetical protein QXK08_04185 [Candidatus Woesearchaeota archaeon]
MEKLTVYRLVNEFMECIKKLEEATGVKAGIPTVELQEKRDPEAEKEIAKRSELMSDGGRAYICVHPVYGCSVKTYLPELDDEFLKEEAMDAAAFFMGRRLTRRFLPKPDGDSDEDTWYCLTVSGPLEVSQSRGNYMTACPAFDVASMFITAYASTLQRWRDKPENESRQLVQEMVESIDRIAREDGPQLDRATTAAISLGIMAREVYDRDGFSKALEIRPPEFLNYLNSLYRECKKQRG